MSVPHADTDIANCVRMLIEYVIEFKSCQNVMNAQDISPDVFVDRTETVRGCVSEVVDLDVDGQFRHQSI